MNKLTLKEYLLYDALKDEPVPEAEMQKMLKDLAATEDGRPVKPHRSGGGHGHGFITNEDD